MNEETTVFWFVGAMYGGRNDQLSRFLDEGIWENGYEDKHLDTVRSMKPGDRIAIKAAYTRKKNLPFNNSGRSVSVMSIKAIGVITENAGDGRVVRVNWQKLDPPREWYFYTNRTTIWQVNSDSWMSKALIDFAFENEPQPIPKFLEDPHWKEMYGPAEKPFGWAEFYEALADRLLDFRNDRSSLLELIYKHVSGINYLKDEFADGSSGPLRDICPFTVFGIFNRGVTDDSRKKIAQELKDVLDLSPAIPEDFVGIPVLHNTKSMFFCFEYERKPDDIEKLWDVFAAAIRSADSDISDERIEFVQSYDSARMIKGVAWNLTMGCYWIRPFGYPTLDSYTRAYLKSPLGIEVPVMPPSAQTYLALVDELSARFIEDTFPVHSFPELSKAAWQKVPPLEGGPSSGDSAPKGPDDPGQSVPYLLSDIIAEGCFVPIEELEQCITKFKSKKNLILQGPPGTGKTWLARRLAFVLVGHLEPSRVRAMQFHPNLSYEDFVRGWRPTADGKLELCDGPFIEAVDAARATPDQPMIVLVEEINRGHPAQILGEMLTLLEADKRRPEDALEICYRKYPGERVHLPENLYMIGTMNIADRSLAIVDFALRRRFAFVDLEPRIGSAWRKWMADHHGVSNDFALQIESRMKELNDTIESDPALGRAFQIGHSYVTPHLNEHVGDPVVWFKRKVDSEIGPLLDEYWFDALDRSNEAKSRLKLGL